MESPRARPSVGARPKCQRASAGLGGLEKASTASERARRSGCQPILYSLPYSHIPVPLVAALSFAQRCQIHVTSSALQVWHKRLATQQGANAFAVQYANAQLQFRILYRWRVQLRAHLKRFRQAKIADKFFVTRQAWKIWVDRAKVRGREKRSREWDKEKAKKLFASTSERWLIGDTLRAKIFLPRRLEGKGTEAAPPSTCRARDSGAY
jgi:hypothetical protein